MDFIRALLFAPNDTTKYDRAIEILIKSQKQLFGDLVLYLCLELANEEKPVATRRSAGLILKNAFNAIQFYWQWLSLDKRVRFQIMETLLCTLRLESEDFRSAACQLVAKFAGFESDLGELPILLDSLFVKSFAGLVKYGTIVETVGYLCKEISPARMDEKQVNLIYEFISEGIVGSYQHDIKLAVIQALCNAKEFARSWFSSDLKRIRIMEAVIHATTSPEVQVQQAAFEFLVYISLSCYEKLEAHIMDIFKATRITVRTAREDIVLQAIGFWTSICQKEIAGPCLNFIENVLPYLVKMLATYPIRQGGTRNIEMACLKCLHLVALTVGEKIFDNFPSFSKQKAGRVPIEAGYYVYGSALEVLSTREWMSEVVAMLIGALKDEPNNHVIWFLCRICEVFPSTVMGQKVIEDHGKKIIDFLMKSMKCGGDVAWNACCALSILARHWDWDDKCLPDGSFNEIVCALCHLVSEEDTGEQLTSAYETLNVVVRGLTRKDASLLIVVADYIMTKLAWTLRWLASDKRKKQGELGLFCMCLQDIIQMLSGMKDLQTNQKDQLLDKMMELLLEVLNCGNATVCKKAMSGLGALAHTTSGPDFEKLMVKCQKHIERGLQNFEEYHLCVVTVDFIADLCRASEVKILPWRESIMYQLYACLSNGRLHRSVKPLIYSCFGDIALAIGLHFKNYLAESMFHLQEAAELEELRERTYGDDEKQHKNSTRIGILKAYSGLLQCFKSSQKTHPLTPNAPHILNFLDIMFMKSDMDNLVKETAIGVIHDLADALGSDARPLILKHPRLHKFLDERLS